jgi:hypothetical protein
MIIYLHPLPLQGDCETYIPCPLQERFSELLPAPFKGMLSFSSPAPFKGTIDFYIPLPPSRGTIELHPLPLQGTIGFYIPLLPANCSHFHGGLYGSNSDMPYFPCSFMRLVIINHYLHSYLALSSLYLRMADTSFSENTDALSAL